MSNASDQIDQIFWDALQITSDNQRRAFLDRACGKDSQLRHRVEKLLKAQPNAEPFLEKPFVVAVPTIDYPHAEQPGTMIGSYKLIEEIGEGGMGSVFMALQKEPVQRKVALKVIRAGMDSRQVVSRFEAERQALAMMDHPNIAKVHDGGATESGRPYFVMELVHGIPITDYCDRYRLTTNQRLKLFGDVCRAVQHAHQKGIIHRDLKPSNILVTRLDGRAIPKVIDFGIAKATIGHLTDESLVTHFPQMIGTPLYMSPEQMELAGQDIDTRTDVYSLGVLLYELLTGTTPLERERMDEVSYDELRRIIREEEPPKPSTRLSTLDGALDTVAEKHHTDLRTLTRQLSGELDWIVMKALEKDRTRRYESASGFAKDVQRYLNNEPVEACPPSRMYLLRKTARRHKTGLTFAATVVALLVLGLIGTSWQAVVATDAKDLAKQRLTEVDQQRNAARRNQYYAEMVAGQVAVANQNAGSLHDRLVNYLPLPGEEDYRDWEWYYLLSRCRPEIRTLVYPGPHPFAAWSPDGQTIGAAGAIWQASTGERIGRFNTSAIIRIRVAWSPDGQKFAWAMAADENAVYIWDRSTGNISRLAGHNSSVWCVAWSPDGAQLATGSLDKTIKIWDLTSETVQWSASIMHNVMSLAWSPDGKLLAAGIAVRGIQVWDVAQRKLLHELPRPGTNHSVAWHPQGNVLAVGADESWCLLKRDDWSVVHQEQISRGGEALAYSPDGAQIAVTHGESVTIWDSNGETKLAQLNGHRRPVMSVSWSPDGRRLVTADNIREIKLWDLDRHDQPPPIDAGVEIESIVWLDDNQTLVTVAHDDGSLAWWDSSTGSLKRREELAVKRPFQLSPDRKLAAVPLEEEHALAILEASSGATHAMLRFDPECKLHAYAFSGDGSQMATHTKADENWFLEVWNVDKEQPVWSWKSEGLRALKFLTWADGGTRIAAVGLGDLGEGGSKRWKNHLHMFDAALGKRIFKHLPVGGDSITTLAWSRDGRFVALGTDDGRLEVVEAENGRRLFSEKIHRDDISALAWHPAGNRLASASRDCEVKLVIGEEGNVLLSFSLPQGSGLQLAWSDDGQRLAALTSEGRVQIWDAGRGYAIAADVARRGELAWAYHDRAERSSGEIRQGALGEFLRRAPDTLDFWEERGGAYAQLGEFERAFEEFSKGVEPDVQYAFQSARYRAYALLGAAYHDRYREMCAWLVDQFGDSPVPSNQGFVAWLCALVPNSHVDSGRVLEMAQACLEGNKDDGGDRWLLSVGACLYRDGQHDGAVQVLSGLAAKLERGGDATDRYHLACAKYFLALARHDLGHAFQARRLLDEANRTTDENPLPSSNRFRHWYWFRPVVLDALRGEATATIGR